MFSTPISTLLIILLVVLVVALALDGWSIRQECWWCGRPRAHFRPLITTKLAPEHGERVKLCGRCRRERSPIPRASTSPLPRHA